MINQAASAAPSKNARRAGAIPYDRPFHLRIHPIRGESVVSFAHRLALHNCISSGNAVRRILARSPAAVSTATTLDRLAFMSGITAETLAATIGDTSSGLGRDTPKQWWRSLETIQVCPQCIEKTPHLRQAWQHRLVATCPIHGCDLLSECPVCAAPLSWRQADRRLCKNGHSLGETPPTLSDDAELVMTRHLFARLGEATGDGSSMIDQRVAALSDKDLVMFICKIALLAARVDPGYDPKSTDYLADGLLRRAVAIAAKWPVSMRDLLGPVSAPGTPFIPDHGLLRWIRGTFLDTISSLSEPVYDLFIAPLRAFASALGDELSLGSHNPNAHLISVRQAAEAMGVQAATALRIAGREGWKVVRQEISQHSWSFLQRSDVDAFCSQERISPAEAVALLGIRRDQLRDLAVHGLLGPATRDDAMKIGKLLSMRRTAVEQFLGRVQRSGERSIPDDELLAFGRFAQRLEGYPFRLLDLLQAAFHGKVHCRLVQEKQTFWMFHKGDVSALGGWRPPLLSEKELTLAEAAGISRFEPKILRQLGEAGLIAISPGAPRNQRVNRESFLAFMAQWADGARLQDLTGRPREKIARRCWDLGIKPVKVGNIRLYDMNELRAHLILPAAPASSSDPGIAVAA